MTEEEIQQEIAELPPKAKEEINKLLEEVRNGLSNEDFLKKMCILANKDYAEGEQTPA